MWFFRLSPGATSWQESEDVLYDPGPRITVVEYKVRIESKEMGGRRDSGDSGTVGQLGPFSVHCPTVKNGWGAMYYQPKTW